MINPKGSDIAGARDLLQQAVGHADHTTGTLIQQALAKMHRATPVRKSANKHRGWSDPHLKQDIQYCLSMYPDWSLQQVSGYCNTNTARVSEVAAGLV